MVAFNYAPSSSTLFRTIWTLVVLSFLGSGVAACANDAGANDMQCQKFVQDFYSWYEKLDASGKKKSMLEQALIAKPTNFSPALMSALRADIKAQSLNPGELVGLDFDPFLNAQDIAKPYEARKVTMKGTHYLVDVYGTWNGKKSAKPDVTPELSLSNGTWIFENFHYDQDKPSTDLIGVLKSLRDERKTYKIKK